MRCFEKFGFFVAFVLLLSHPLKASSRGVDILDQDETGLTLSLIPQNWSIDTVAVNGKEWLSADFAGAEFAGTPGIPRVANFNVTLGVPLNGQIAARVVSIESQTITGYDLIPEFDYAGSQSGPTMVLTPDQAIYAGRGEFPSNAFTLSEAVFFRAQRTVTLSVPAIRYLPASNQVDLHQRIVIAITFQRSVARAVQIPVQSEAEESLYRSVVFNYEQARPWRKSRPVEGARKISAPASIGTFYQFSISESGIYRFDGTYLESQNINLASIVPARVRLFGNGGRERPRSLSAINSGPQECAILVEDGGDGRFDRGDAILFYASGPSGWDYDLQRGRFRHYINRYQESGTYFFSFDGDQDGKRITAMTSLPVGPNPIERYKGLYFNEEESENPLRSGMNWFGRKFDDLFRSQNYPVNLPDAIPESEAFFNFALVALSDRTHTFTMSVDDQIIGTRAVAGYPLSLGEYLALRHEQASFTHSNLLNAGQNSVRISHAHTQKEAQAMVDWFEIQYDARLQAQDNELLFRVVPQSEVESYRVSNLSGQARLFDVSDIANVMEISGLQTSGAAVSFSMAQIPDSAKTYIVSNADAFKDRPDGTIQRMQYIDLRAAGLGAEFIIITHNDFLSEAARLQSYRENGNLDNSLSTEVVSISDIYSNFSNGQVDPTAIRDFLEYAYENWSPSPSYVLLFGDGDYDYKNKLSNNDSNWIPTYQTDDLENSNRLDELVSRTADSWFSYVSGNDNVMDVAIGRVNIQSLEDAKTFVDKLIAYEMQPLRGKWRNTVTVVGDDELVRGGNPDRQDVIHINQAENIAESYIPKSFDLRKIYLSEYPKVISASVGGITKPAAKDALVNQINEGTLIVNYTGHGNSTLWAHERIFLKSDNDLLTNEDKLTFFVAATCDWALFDNPSDQSHAEELLLMDSRGAIAILSSARLVFANTNFTFNTTYYDNLFRNQGFVRLGDAFVATRAGRIDPTTVRNDEKFHIYGDPTMRLAVPRQRAVITSVNPDSIVALTMMQISGEVQQDGGLWNDFDGTALVTVFDSRRFVQNVTEADGFTQEYFLAGNSIYRGTVPVRNGIFSAQFVVPKDLSYGGSQARVSAYFWNQQTDGIGYQNNIVVSSSSSSLVDTDGPEIKIYFENYENFTTGDIVEEDAILVVELADTLSGINIAGEIGHRITLTVDPEDETCLSEFYQFQGISNIDLTEAFTFDEGNPFRGKVRFPLQFPRQVDLGGRIVSCTTTTGEDRHTLLIKAWDNSNNSSTASVEVVVVHEEGLVLASLMNYPNPFRESTTFTFKSNRDAEVEIKIYTLSGQLIRTLEYPFAIRGFNMVDWDGLDADGDELANGVYLYKIVARALGSEGVDQEEKIGRVAIIR
jgi:hypothetical protein